MMMIAVPISSTAESVVLNTVDSNIVWTVSSECTSFPIHLRWNGWSFCRRLWFTPWLIRWWKWLVSYRCTSSDSNSGSKWCFHEPNVQYFRVPSESSRKKADGKRREEMVSLRTGNCGQERDSYFWEQLFQFQQLGQVLIFSLSLSLPMTSGYDNELSVLSGQNGLPSDGNEWK